MRDDNDAAPVDGAVEAADPHEELGSASALGDLEREVMILGRHTSTRPGSTRRRGGLLDQSAYVLLHYLSASGPVTLSALSEATGLDRSTLSRQTSALRRLELAEQVPGAPLASSTIRATSEGLAALQEEREASWRAMQLITSGWTPAEIDAFAAVLERYNRDTEQWTGRGWPRPVK